MINKKALGITCLTILGIAGLLYLTFLEYYLVVWIILGTIKIKSKKKGIQSFQRTNRGRNQNRDISAKGS